MEKRPRARADAHKWCAAHSPIRGVSTEDTVHSDVAALRIDEKDVGGSSVGTAVSAAHELGRPFVSQMASRIGVLAAPILPAAVAVAAVAAPPASIAVGGKASPSTKGVAAVMAVVLCGHVEVVTVVFAVVCCCYCCCCGGGGV